ncbi:type II/IV secretion system ATPase subunit [Methanoregula formicica]|uniref:ATPase, type IV secretory pathway VirB11 component like protein n=1 Tax=Methanoregula formicica (strain DSM 22288 / NBRC 105244 / SMSP) TaxID=593750 RepID=L0HGB1_METFS|nr:type II/IV secretion system ATPase subunit [Methanoregula formicica]AGB02119.1 ATPase, type IV secretory pathway VirB11 component like protein [Methanoregula formicica SMSP]
MADKDGEPLDDVEGLLTRIGTMKKEAPPAGGKEGEATKSPAGTPAEPPATSGGDFSLLMKKLGMGETREKDPGPASSPSPAPPAEPQEDQQAPAIVTLDDLLEAEEPPATAAEEVTSAAETAVEIIDEDPRGSLWKKKPKPTVTADPAPQPPKEAGTDAEEKIISVDQITDLSGLILPKSATFEVEELKLHSRVSAYDGQSIGSLPDEFDEIWKKELFKAGFKDLDLGDVVAAGETKAPPAAKKFSIAGLFAAIRTEEEEYDAKKHGPLVDLFFTPRPGIEEIELYPVNEPYAYVRIIYDHATHEYTYNVIEPVLAEQENDLLKEVKERLFETLDINTKDITRDEARLKLREATNDVLQDYGIRLTPVQKEKLHYNMHKDFLGDGLIDPVMHDKYIEDISCDGVHTPIFAFHSSYESMKTTLAYHTAEDLDSFVTKLAQRAGKYISIAEPILDATMQDGSRIQMTLGTEVTAHGSTFTIRKFKDEPITPTDLIEWHTFAPLSIAYIWLAVENGKSAIFAGGTASGKTTALNAISLFIPPMAKIVSLEDTREVKLPHPNWIPSVTRDSFDTAGRGEINMYELLRAAMRQRPEYIIVGEVRGKECQTLFQAMSTGHVTYSTTHADSVASVVHRIENPPMDVPRNMLSALDFICVQVQARVGGKRIRRNKQIVEILDIDPRTNELITNEVFKWRSATDEHTYSGKSYLLEEIMEAKGWDEGRMREELKRRQEVLEWMRIKKIRHYRDVAKTLISYHRDPETVIEKVRKDLYE